MFEDFSDLRISERTSEARERVLSEQRGPRKELVREEQVKVIAN